LKRAIDFVDKSSSVTMSRQPDIAQPVMINLAMQSINRAAVLTAAAAVSAETTALRPVP
jgi:hypothetical protein